MSEDAVPERIQDILDEALALEAQGDRDAATERWEQALDAAEDLGTSPGLEVATEIAARLAVEAPSDRQAQAWREKAKALGEAAGTPRSLRIAADATWTQADAHVHADRLDRAEACYRDAIALGRAAGSSDGLATGAWACLDLARLLMATDRPEAAKPVLQQGLTLAEEHEPGFPDLVSMVTVILGQANARTGDAEGAVAAWQHALDLGRPPLEGRGDVCRREAARASLLLGVHREAQGDPSAAREAYLEAVDLGSFQRPDQAWHAGSHAALEAAARLAGLSLGDDRDQAADEHLATATELLRRAEEALPEELFDDLVGELAAEAQVSETLAHGWRALRQDPDT